MDTKATSKTSAAAVVSADSDCNIHYLMDLSGYSETSTAYKLTYAKLRLDGMFNKARRTATEIRMGPFNENFIVRHCFFTFISQKVFYFITGIL